MRVMQLTTDFRFGGAERVVVNLARGLRQRGVDCAVAGLFAGGDARGWTRVVLEQDGFEIFCARMERRYAVWRMAGLQRFVRQWRPDVLHCHLFHGHAAGLVLKLLGLRCPMVWTHHAIYRGAVPLRNGFYRLFPRAARCHVFPSEATQRYQNAHGVRPPSGGWEQVIPNGIELAPYLALRPAAGPVFGSVGRLVPEKGFDVLLHAFARLCREDAGVRLRIGGDGRARGSLEALARAEGVGQRAEFVGFVERVPEFLAGVNVFVFPSRWESFGIALVEAMAAGLPCIATRVGGMPEVGGDLVRWVEPEDVEGLYRAMRELRGALSPERIARQREAAGRFSAEAMVESYLEVYQAVLAPVREG
jgi:glycosyltransferase involved in cell wall biosynthesis